MAETPTPTNDVYPLHRELNLLAPERVRFRRNGFDDLVMALDGQEPVVVRLLRTFPHSAAERMIAVRDTEGTELGILAAVSTLEAESRKAVEHELERLYFIPRILRVVDVQERFHVPIWEVETDRGPRRFEIRSGRRDVQLLGRRLLIRDADGNHYEVPDYARLDAASQALIESQI